jgi:ferrous iron transport protein B
MKKVLLVGSPNSGKSMLFNRMTGMNQRVANFPGITVSTHAGMCRDNHDLEVVDFPGVYSLQTISGEEEVAVEAFNEALMAPVGDIAAVVCVVDGTRLEKGLFFALQVREACRASGHPMVIASNMTDILSRHDMAIDAHGLAESLGVVVLPVSARSGEGVAALVALLGGPLSNPESLLDKNIIAVDQNRLRNIAEDLTQRFGPKGDYLLRSHTKADQFFLHTVTGGVSFVLIMFLLFQSIFTWAAPLMDGVEALVGAGADAVLPLFSEGWARDFVADALFGGLGSFLVFVPQIFILTMVVGMMEDSGYLARAAVICHRPLRSFGLTGKSFVPMLSGVACAIPGIYAARTIESPRRRWLTYLAIPLMPCSARLPVYGLLIAAFIPDQTVLGGWVGLQGLAMLFIYLLGIVAGLLVVAVVSRFERVDSDDTPFVLEMPPYRLPGLLTLFRHAWERAGDFVKRAGPVIFWVSLVVWVLGYMPNYGTDLGASWLGAAGRFIEPIFEPLGLDWKYGVAILASFLAREVFVGTLGTLFGIADSEENIGSLAEQITASGLSLASGVAIVVFFALASQCISTLATLRRESRSWRLPAQLFVGYGIMAYAVAFLFYSLIAAFN